MIKLSLEEVLELHELIINRTGGGQGIRDIDLVDSTINSAFQTVVQNEMFATSEEKISRITWGIINNHPFIDGNKRIGILLMLLLIELCDIKIKYSKNDLVYIGMSLADGSMNYRQLLDWIEFHKING